MIWAIASTICAGLFAGAAIYINLVEHPARLECGERFALREFAPSYRRVADRRNKGPVWKRAFPRRVLHRVG